MIKIKRLVFIKSHDRDIKILKDNKIKKDDVNQVLRDINVINV